MLMETENPVTYVQRQLKKLEKKTERNPEGDPLMATAMTQAVKSKLEDMVGLNSETHKEFCNHVSHEVDVSHAKYPIYPWQQALRGGGWVGKHLFVVL